MTAMNTSVDFLLPGICQTEIRLGDCRFGKEVCVNTNVIVDNDYLSGERRALGDRQCL